jgi:TRAP transporter TAXI family solute receptor
MREIPQLTVTVIEGGSLSNTRLVQAGVDAQVSMAFANVLQDAMEGVHTEGVPMHRLSVGRPFKSSYASIVVRPGSGIENIEEVWTRRIGTSTVGGGADQVWLLILDYYGLTWDDVRAKGGAVSRVSFSEQVTLLKDGHLDVGMFTGDMPHPSLLELETVWPVDVIDLPEAMIDDLTARFPYIAESMIREGTYSGMTRDVRSLQIPGMIFFNHERIPDDMAYLILHTLMLHREEIVTAFPTIDLLCWEDYTLGVDQTRWNTGARRLYEDYRAGLIE